MIDENHYLVRAVLEAFPDSTIVRKGKKMAWSEEQNKAIIEAGDAAGEYLDMLRKTNLADLTLVEWRVLIETIITKYHSELIPF